MIFDSQDQKNFLLEAVRKYPCNYEQALQLANAFGQSVQDGQIIDIKRQVKAFPPVPAVAQANPQAGKAGQLPAPIPATGKNGKRGAGKRRRSTV